MTAASKNTLVQNLEEPDLIENTMSSESTYCNRRIVNHHSFQVLSMFAKSLRCAFSFYRLFKNICYRKSVRGSLTVITCVSWNRRAYCMCAQACAHGPNHW